MSHYFSGFPRTISSKNGKPIRRKLSVGWSVRPSFCWLVRPSFRRFIYPSIRPSMHPLVRSLVRRSVGRSVCLSIRPSVRLSVYTSDRPSVYPSVRPSAYRLNITSVCGSVGPSVHRLNTFWCNLHLIFSFPLLPIRAPIKKMTKAQWQAKSHQERLDIKAKYEFAPDEEFRWIPPAPQVIGPATLLGLWLRYFPLHANPDPIMPDQPLQHRTWLVTNMGFFMITFT